MIIEFLNQNILWVLAFFVVFNLLVFTYMKDQVKGVNKISPLHLPQLQRTGKHIIIDVSDSTEYQKSHIPESINIPLADISVDNNALLKNKNKTTILVCQTGSKSIQAAKKLIGLGFTDLHSLNGGLHNWNKENLPVTSN